MPRLPHIAWDPENGEAEDELGRNDGDAGTYSDPGKDVGRAADVTLLNVSYIPFNFRLSKTLTIPLPHLFPAKILVQ
jgi:hypothetical protein